jgi:hypothetical protein
MPGSATINYYANQTDALAGTNILASGVPNGNILLTVGSYASWRIAKVLNGSTLMPAPAGLYVSGYNLATVSGFSASYTYFLYASTICFLEGTQILCLVDDVEKYVPIETMRAGFLVKTSCDGYKKVELIGKSTMKNRGDSERIEDRLYKLSPSKYPELKEDLFITGAHSVLVDTITDKQRDEISKQLGRIFVTDGKYRLMAMLDERAEPWASEGKYTIWHFALEHENIVMNYGVYANGGLLVETCSINTMRTKSNLDIV